LRKNGLLKKTNFEMKKAIFFILFFGVLACKKQEVTSFSTPDCVQMQINSANLKDCGWNCLVEVVQYEYKSEDYYMMSYSRSDFSGKNNYLLDNQCDTICFRSHLDCDLNCGKFQNFFKDAKKIKTVFGD
jgi:hypothetical protein